MQYSYSQPQVENIRHVAHVIGDEHNLLILFELHKFGEKSFNELKRMTKVNQVTLSKKLTLLKEQGYVATKQCANEKHYFVTEKAAAFDPLVQIIEKLALSM